MNEVLAKAAELIGEFGHRKKDLGGEDRGFCAQGAICYAVSGDMSSYVDERVREATTTLAVSLGHEPGPGAFDLDDSWGHNVEWNNAPERSAEDVILALKRAAAE